MEIAALHQAEKKALGRTSKIRRELGSSEKELGALEREINEIGARVPGGNGCLGGYCTVVG